MKNYWQAGLFGVLILLILFLIYRDYRRDQEIALLLSQRPAAGKDGRTPVDPYIKNEVKNRIIKGYGELQICYKEFLKTNPKITDGDIKMDWQIDTDGDVISPEVITSPFSSESFHKCMAGKIESWKFPEPPIQKYISHTFKFAKSE
ncbi:MAG: AgmX/PglI C-terminal domain-containing protein [Spirochaetia bacterium]|nr:AgmX/PglI C-terminal domain-containing protein [Spirochaetia bacterium]